MRCKGINRSGAACTASGEAAAATSFNQTTSCENRPDVDRAVSELLLLGIIDAPCSCGAGWTRLVVQNLYLNFDVWM